MIKKFDKKDEESGSGSNPFQHLEKSAILQEARIFNETPINPRRCLHILTKILYLLNQGEHFGTTEATEAFFAMTRLFQSNDQTLRRMCYLTIKEMANISEDVIIVTSSLTKDMTGKEDVYRGPAIRALCRITDGTMLQAIERYMKQAIVDKVPSVSSSALVSSLHMMKVNYDVVKRWINEAQEAASSDNVMVQVRVPQSTGGIGEDFWTQAESWDPFGSHPGQSTFLHLIPPLQRAVAGSSNLASLRLVDFNSQNSRANLTGGRILGLCSHIVAMGIAVVSWGLATIPLLHTHVLCAFPMQGGFEYKRAIVDCIIGIIEENPESKETGLAHLCEFIEDCEHTVLATKILHLLGKEGPRTPTPSKYIRFIFNRVVLENEAVRAAAVSALAKFGAQNENLLPSILVLLQRCVMDSDDEVRDRATFYLNVLQQRQLTLNAAYIFNGLTVSIPGMEKALHQYTLEPSEKPFDMRSVPLATAPIFEQKAEISLVANKPEKVAPSRQDIFQEQLAAIPEFKSLGPLFKSSEAVQLTEHVFSNHIVFQFDCTNTLNDQLLEKVTVQMEPSEAYVVLRCIPAPSLSYNQPGMCYTLVHLPLDDPTTVACTFSCTMKFTVRDCDPNTGVPDDDGYDDEYVLEDLELTLSDHREEATCSSSRLEETNPSSCCRFFSKSLFNVEAVNNIVKFLGMQPCERSDKVPENKNSHTLYLAGMFRGGLDVLVRARLALGDGVTMQVTVRSIVETPVDVILASVG
uniref:Coatomer subunit gamma n=1 Tax=Naja naja TaxID=35670 RepID=A0A8C6XKW2_NAJNA